MPDILRLLFNKRDLQLKLYIKVGHYDRNLLRNAVSVAVNGGRRCTLYPCPPPRHVMMCNRLFVVYAHMFPGVGWEYINNHMLAYISQ